MAKDGDLNVPSEPRIRFSTPPATASATTLYVASVACLVLALLAAALAASFVSCPAHVR